MKKTEDSDAFSKVKHKHDDPVTSFHYALAHKSIIYVTTRLVKRTHQIGWQGSSVVDCLPKD